MYFYASKKSTLLFKSWDIDTDKGKLKFKDGALWRGAIQSLFAIAFAILGIKET
jgi:hypothetical protein